MSLGGGTTNGETNVDNLGNSIAGNETLIASLLKEQQAVNKQIYANSTAISQLNGDVKDNSTALTDINDDYLSRKGTAGHDEYSTDEFKFTGTNLNFLADTDVVMTLSGTEGVDLKNVSKTINMVDGTDDQDSATVGQMNRAITQAIDDIPAPETPTVNLWDDSLFIKLQPGLTTAMSYQLTSPGSSNYMYRVVANLTQDKLDWFVAGGTTLNWDPLPDTDSVGVYYLVSKGDGSTVTGVAGSYSWEYGRPVDCSQHDTRPTNTVGPDDLGSEAWGINIPSSVWTDFDTPLSVPPFKFPTIPKYSGVYIYLLWLDETAPHAVSYNIIPYPFENA